MWFRFSIFLIMISSVLGGCAGAPTSPSELYKGQSAEALYLSGEEALAQGRYREAISRFEGLLSLYPYGEHAEQAQLNLIYAYYENGDYASAVAAAERYIRLYPRSPKVDYAYYIKGVANFEQDRGIFNKLLPSDLSQRDPGTMRDAFNDFSQLLTRFPNSPYAADARQRLIYLRELLAKHELNIAQHYYAKGAYVAAINRATYLIEHYQGAVQVEPALVLLVNANRALGHEEAAQEALQVLQKNFPASKEGR